MSSTLHSQLAESYGRRVPRAFIQLVSPGAEKGPHVESNWSIDHSLDFLPLTLPK